MKTSIENKNEIIEILRQYISEFPEERFGQILFNLNINQFKQDETDLRDIYNDFDEEILSRIIDRLEIFKIKKNS